MVIDDSPSLRRLVPEYITSAYRTARKKASQETGLPIEAFPEEPAADLERAVLAERNDA
jgi:hypothetical protein